MHPYSPTSLTEGGLFAVPRIYSECMPVRMGE